MADIETSQQMAIYFADHPPMIRGRVVYIQYSNHEELKVEASQQVWASEPLCVHIGTTHVYCFCIASVDSAR